MPHMLRHAADEVVALDYMNAIEEAGGEVIGVTTDRSGTYPGAREPHLTFIVWARVADDVNDPPRVDDLFEARTQRAET